MQFMGYEIVGIKEDKIRISMLSCMRQLAFGTGTYNQNTYFII